MTPTYGAGRESNDPADEAEVLPGRTDRPDPDRATERATTHDSYRSAQEVLSRLPLSQEDDWGDVEDFMLQATPHHD